MRLSLPAAVRRGGVAPAEVRLLLGWGTPTWFESRTLASVRERRATSKRVPLNGELSKIRPSYGGNEHADAE
jgi:hypothetical protein